MGKPADRANALSVFVGRWIYVKAGLGKEKTVFGVPHGNRHPVSAARPQSDRSDGHSVGLAAL